MCTEKQFFAKTIIMRLLGTGAMLALLSATALGADVMIAPSGQPVEISGMDSPQPDTIRYDTGGSAYLYMLPNLWGCVRFTVPQDFQLRCIYMQMFNPNSVSNGVEVNVRQNSGGQPGALITGPYRIHGPLWIGGNWLDVEIDPPYPIIDPGQDFMVVLGPAPSGLPTQGWFLYLDYNGNTENRSGYATSQSGPFDFEYFPGDLIVRAGGEYNPVAPSVSIDLTPAITPVIIPASGGSFDFTVSVSLDDSATQWIHLWSDVLLPDSTVSGPLFGPVPINLPPGISQWSRTQEVPSAAPVGNYIYRGYVGVYPNTVYHSDSFPFEKLAGGDGKIIEDWSNWGDDFLQTAPSPAETPSEFLLCKNYPNPFNPATAISYQLTANSYVHLKVYDTAGKLVQTLVNGWREAGLHEVAFDGTSLPSGVYIYFISAGKYAGAGKMLLIK